MKGGISMENKDKSMIDGCISRRAFLIGSGAAVAGTVILNSIPGLEGKAIAAEVTTYPRKKIGKLSRLKLNKPVSFKYPDNGKNSQSIIVKLGAPAGGGIGSGGDVVAFNTLCTHMGGPMGRFYKPGDRALGPCPYHQSTFDLTKHGMAGRLAQAPNLFACLFPSTLKLVNRHTFKYTLLPRHPKYFFQASYTLHHFNKTIFDHRHKLLSLARHLLELSRRGAR